MCPIVGKKSGIAEESDSLCDTVRPTLQLMEPCSDGATDSNSRCNTEWQDVRENTGLLTIFLELSLLIFLPFLINAASFSDCPSPFLLLSSQPTLYVRDPCLMRWTHSDGF